MTNKITLKTLESRLNNLEQTVNNLLDQMFVVRNTMDKQAKTQETPQPFPDVDQRDFLLEEKAKLNQQIIDCGLNNLVLRGQLFSQMRRVVERLEELEEAK
jgi:hypothetical protein